MFTDRGDLANLDNQNDTVHEIITLAGTFYIAIVVYTKESPFPRVKNGREVEGEILGGVALGMALNSHPDKYAHALARFEQKDEVFIGTIGKYVSVSSTSASRR